jgi:hypothetical protein
VIAIRRWIVINGAGQNGAAVFFELRASPSKSASSGWSVGTGAPGISRRCTDGQSRDRYFRDDGPYFSNIY